MEEKTQFEEYYGSITVETDGEFIAGTYTSITLKYTAGIYGMDDLGGLKVLFRYACDQSPLQNDDPKGVGYTTAVASNGANVEMSYALRESERPWYKQLRLRIAGIGLKKGDTITIRLGDTEGGSPGMRLQTFVEPRFEFRTLVDVFSTNSFKYIPSPEISIDSGIPEKWVAVLPTLRHKKDKFSLKIRAEDKWGNPSNKMDGDFLINSSVPINNLPSEFMWEKGSPIHIINDLSLIEAETEQSVVLIEILGFTESVLTTSNPLIIKSEQEFLHYWGDIHGQSGETIGSNTAKMYFEFARDYAFLDVIGHQGNDFQITKEFWKQVNDLSEEFNSPGKFIVIPGYEYSANTALGGDRNVYFLKPYQQIHRSSHELIPDEDDIDTDSLTASELFDSLIADNPNADDSVVVNAHVGGRYADILNHHNGRIESSIEIHSAWGTFEWLLHDAFERGYRMGIVANGDDHKCRPGISYPGASKFGAYGGLTCFLIPELTRKAVFTALKRRHHYATTGERIFLDVQANFNKAGMLFKRDPTIYEEKDNDKTECNNAWMGDIVKIPDEGLEITLKIAVEANFPIERIEIFNGLELIDIIKPYLDSSNEECEKIRILWEGAEFRARRRNAQWNGNIEFTQNEILKITEFNFWNIDAPLHQNSSNKVSWDTYTSGNFQGFDVVLSNSRTGKLIFKSSQVDFDLPISEISTKDTIFEAGGLGKRVRIFRLPENNLYKAFKCERTLPIIPTEEKDERIFVKVTLENGHQAWSSPMYFIK